MLRGQHVRGGPKLPHGRAAVATNKYSGSDREQYLAKRLQFRVDTHMLEFAGRCATCLAKAS